LPADCPDNDTLGSSPVIIQILLPRDVEMK